MVSRVEIIEVGDELGIVLPEGALQHLNARIGDEVILVERAGGFKILRRPSEPPAQDGDTQS